MADDGTVLGVENDLKTLSKPDLDAYEQTLRNVLAEFLGPEFGYLAKSAFEQVDGLTVAVVQVEQSPKPVFLKEKDGAEFFVRVGNTTKPLDPEAAYDYIDMHWET